MQAATTTNRNQPLPNRSLPLPVRRPLDRSPEFGHASNDRHKQTKHTNTANYENRNDDKPQPTVTKPLIAVTGSAALDRSQNSDMQPTTDTNKQNTQTQPVMQIATTTNRNKPLPNR